MPIIQTNSVPAVLSMCSLIQVKEAAKKDFVKGAGKLVRETLMRLPVEACVPNARSLQRAANRAPAVLRPKHPPTLDFEVIAFCHPIMTYQIHFILSINLIHYLKGIYLIAVLLQQD